MTPEKVTNWVEFYGNASAFAALAHVAKDREAAVNFESNADLAFGKVRDYLGGDVPVESAPAAEPVTDRCAHCGDTIDIIDGKWKHRPGLRSPHDPVPWPTSPHSAATTTVPHNRKETSQ